MNRSNTLAGMLVVAGGLGIAVAGVAPAAAQCGGASHGGGGYSSQLNEASRFNTDAPALSLAERRAQRQARKDAKAAKASQRAAVQSVAVASNDASGTAEPALPQR